VAGQGVSAVGNGMATAADWMSAASFISMAGLIAFMGYDGAVYLLGWTGGYVLLALLLAPFLRKFGKYTVPDFVGDRYYSNTARLVAVVAAIFVSFTYVAGQMRGVGVVFSRFLEVPVDGWGVAIGMVIVAFYATLGGMKGVTYTQIAQYCVLIFAYLVPAIAIAILLTGNPIPQMAIEDVLPRLNAISEDLGLTGLQLALHQPVAAQRPADHHRADGRDGGPAARDRALLHGEVGRRHAGARGGRSSSSPSSTPPRRRSRSSRSTSSSIRWRGGRRRRSSRSLGPELDADGADHPPRHQRRRHHAGGGALRGQRGAREHRSRHHRARAPRDRAAHADHHRAGRCGGSRPRSPRLPGS
jgi:hypothetical protein